MRNFRLAAATTCAVLFATSVSAQQYNRPWGFQAQNRAQLAVVMEQMENGGSSALAGGAGGGSGTTIVCGGGSATATANNTCIIMNNSTGQVVTDQISDGDQTASNSEQIAVNGDAPTGADEVLSTLAQ